MMLDQFTPAARYAIVLIVLVPAVAFVTALATLVITSGGVTDVDWGPEFVKSANATAVAAANGILAWIALYVLPITRRFGIGKQD